MAIFITVSEVLGSLPQANSQNFADVTLQVNITVKTEDAEIAELTEVYVFHTREKNLTLHMVAIASVD